MEYICKECCQVFYTPQYWEEKHGLDYPPFERWSGCPFCGGSYTETIECDGCGEYIFGEYIKTIDGRYYCEECYEKRGIDND